MKRRLLMLFLLSFVFMTIVEAKNFNASDLPGGVIVVGKHLWYVSTGNVIDAEGISYNDLISRTKSANDYYTGILYSKPLMAAAATIEDSSVSNMIVYSKSFGKWRDTIEGTYVTNVPDSFDIWYVNGECIQEDGCVVPDPVVETVDVTFKSDGAVVKTVKVAKNGSLGTDNVPTVTKNGFTFDFWSLPGATEAFDFTKSITDNITLEANWKAITYSVIYHSNFGGDDKTKTIQCKKNDPSMPCELKAYLDVLADNDNVGNEFLGWSKTPIKAGLLGDDETLESLLGSDVEIHLYAIWKLNTYSLTYNSGGGDPQVINCLYNNICSLESLEAAARPGYYFDHWYFITGEGDDEQQVTLKNEFKNLTIENKNFEVFAFYKPIIYPISYNLEGGKVDTGENPNSINVLDTDGVLIGINPVREGYTFDGWQIANAEDAEHISLSSEGGQNKVKLNMSNLIDDNSGFVIKANWKENKLTIKMYDENGNPYLVAGGTDEVRSIECKYTEKNTCVIAFDPTTLTPERTDRKFVGWEYNGIIYVPSTAFSTATLYSSVSSEISVKAVWDNKKSSLIEYVLDGGKFVEGATPLSKISEGTTIQLPLADTLTREGYEFEGWYYSLVANPGETLNPVTEVTYSDTDLKLYAKWKPITYTISLYDDTDKIEDIACTYDAVCSLKDHSTLFEGTNFIGWGFNKDTLFYGDNLNVINVTSVKGAVVSLYAVRGAYYNVSVYLDGGTLTNAFNINDVISVGSNAKTMTVDLSSYTPTRVGYQFKGWQYNGEDVPASGIVEITSDTLFVPKWEIEKYTVKLTYAPGNEKTIEVEHGNVVAGKDISGVDTSGLWFNDDTEISDLLGKLYTTSVTSNMEYKKIYNVSFVFESETKSYKVVTNEKVVSQVSDLDLSGTWYLGDTKIDDLSTYINDNSVISNLRFVKGINVNFVGSDGTKVYNVKGGEKLDTSEFDNSVTDNMWYLENTLHDSDSLESYFNDNVISVEVNFYRAYTIKFEDNDEYSYNAKYNDIFDKSKLDSSITSSGVTWYLGDTRYSNVTEYFDSNKVVDDLTFVRAYNIVFMNNTSSELVVDAKYNKKYNVESLNSNIKDGIWFKDGAEINLTDYFDTVISGNVTLFRGYELKFVHDSEESAINIQAGKSVTAEQLDEMDFLDGVWHDEDGTEITDLANYLETTNVSKNKTFTKE